MFGVMIFCWLCVSFYFSPRIIALLVGPENIFAKFAIILFALLLNLFWFYGFYHLIIILFSYRGNTQVDLDNQETLFEVKNPRVALLYATCDDFIEKAVLSCIEQDYSNFSVFILDDGDNYEYRKEIDAFAAEYNDKVNVIRRDLKKGYKAGNINNCLKQISGFKLFSISDADTILPGDYISKLLSYFNNEKVAFVQARQELNPEQDSKFAQDLGYQIGLHYDRYLKTKNAYGFVLFYGHGALMRTDVWQKIGGFPEIATEDLAYTLKIREKGYQGIYAEEVTCLEDYPAAYKQYRKRNEKWIRGTAECLLKYFPGFARCSHIQWVEKFDVLASACSLLLAFPFFLLLLLVGIILPIYFSHFRFQGPMFDMPVAYDGSMVNLVLGVSGNLFWTWDFFLLLLIASISPVLPAITSFLTNPEKKIRYIIMYTFMFYAMQVASSLSLIAYLITRTASFPITGRDEKPLEIVRGKSFMQFLKSPISNRHEIVMMEGIFAVIFFVTCLASDNIWFLTFSSGLVLSILLFRFSFNNKIIKHLVAVSWLILMLISAFIAKTLQ
ncbi:MAG: glycosyltransferase [Candidatus Omnitrophica bacterium]|nr:glycosyltransferase [Candidatus Omnitrophota bacterium]